MLITITNRASTKKHSNTKSLLSGGVYKNTSYVSKNTDNSYKNISYVIKNPSNVKKNIANIIENCSHVIKDISYSNKETIDSKKKTIDVKKETSDSNKETIDVNKETSDSKKKTRVDKATATTATFALPYSGFGATSFTIDSLNLFEEYDINKTVATKVTSGGEDSYRFGFNGGEKINEVYGEGNYVDLGERGVDVRLGRLNWSIDPLANKYAGAANYYSGGMSIAGKSVSNTAPKDISSTVDNLEYQKK